MALVIRLRQQGAKNQQTFRVVVTDKRNPRDGKYLESLGWYNALGQVTTQVDVQRLQYWVGLGAQMSECVENLVQNVAPALWTEMTKKKVLQREKARKKRRA